MPVLPEEALQKLICLSCKKYLSIFPVKVYPNKNVICGRCKQVGGTISRLYELVAKQVEFPCISRFEGCKEVLPASDLKTHETTCYSDEYQCPLCSDFSGDLNCLESGLEDGKGIIISLLNHKYPKNIVFCKFQVWDPVLVVEKYRYNKKCVDVQCNLPQVNDASVKKALLRFKFVDISNLKENTESYSNCKYWVGDICWYLRIKRSVTDQNDNLGVYLYRKESEKKCKVKVTFTLVSLTPIINKSSTFIKDNFNSNWGFHLFITRDDLLDPIKGYVKNDSITFQVLLDVRPYKAVMCNKCKTVCSKCD